MIFARRLNPFDPLSPHHKNWHLVFSRCTFVIFWTLLATAAACKRPPTARVSLTVQDPRRQQVQTSWPTIYSENSHISVWVARRLTAGGQLVFGVWWLAARQDICCRRCCCRWVLLLLLLLQGLCPSWLTRNIATCGQLYGLHGVSYACGKGHSKCGEWLLLWRSV